MTVSDMTTISLEDIIPQNIVCSQTLRAFFKEHLGKGFRFMAEFQDWLHDNAGKTFKDAVEAYNSIEHPKEIKPQFEYNQNIRDFFADNKGMALKDAIRSECVISVSWMASSCPERAAKGANCAALCARSILGWFFDTGCGRLIMSSKLSIALQR